MKGKIYEPAYNDYSVLMFCLNSLWGNMIEITSYNKTDNEYTGTLKFTLYDHFGLDLNDITDYPFDGFKAWYVLQHSKAFKGEYQPFITIMEIEIAFSGTLS